MLRARDYYEVYKHGAGNFLPKYLDPEIPGAFKKLKEGLRKYSRPINTDS
jgi:hypothetical protein